jgi:hypothetical protein
MTQSLLPTMNMQQINASFEQRVLDRRSGKVDAVTAVAERLDTLSKRCDQLAHDLHRDNRAATTTLSQLADALASHDRDTERFFGEFVALRTAMAAEVAAAPVVLMGLTRVGWIVLVRMLLLRRQMQEALREKQTTLEPWTLELSRDAQSFDFVQNAKGQHNIQVSDKAIGVYTVHQLFMALTSCVEAIDALGWSPAAHEYFMALFWRYALILHEPVEFGHSAAGAYAARTQDDACELLRPAMLRTEFLDVTQCVLFHHLLRFRAVRHLVPPDLLARPLNVPAVERWARWRTEVGLPSFVACCEHGFQRDALMREANLARISTMIAPRFLFPGERERFRGLFADEGDDEATSVLFRLRLDTYQKLQELHKVPPAEQVRRYVAHTRQTAPLADEVSAAASGRLFGQYFDQYQHTWAFERMALLIFEVAFDTDCVSNLRTPFFTAHAFVDDRALDMCEALPPCSLATIARAAERNSAWPLFFAVWQCYWVVVFETTTPTTPRIVLRTPHLVDALAVWLWYAVRDGKLNIDSLKAPWAGLLAALPVDEPLVLL